MAKQELSKKIPKKFYAFCCMDHSDKHEAEKFQMSV